MESFQRQGQTTYNWNSGIWVPWANYSLRAAELTLNEGASYCPSESEATVHLNVALYASKKVWREAMHIPAGLHTLKVHINSPGSLRKFT